MNAITLDQRERLISLFSHASRDPAVRAVVLTATGRGFCAGADLRRRVNNWGRWGAADEIGTLNLITDEVVRDAAATARTGRRVPLAVPRQ